MAADTAAGPQFEADSPAAVAFMAAVAAVSTVAVVVDSMAVVDTGNLIRS
jgi:hypothetical protein